MKQLSLLSTDFDNKVKVEMTTEEFLAYKAAAMKQPKRRILRGLAGICELFGCSKAHAFKISHEEWFQPAKVPLGRRHFIFDADLAWQLAQRQKNKKPASQRA